MKKIRIVLMLILIVTVFSSCSHYHYANSDVYFYDFDGSGKHISTITIPSSQTDGQDLWAVNNKVMPVLLANKPLEDMEVVSEVINDNLYIYLIYHFTSLTDMEEKAEFITGNDYTFTSYTNDDPFLKTQYFSGFSFNESDFTDWALRAVDNANLFSRDNLVNDTSNGGEYIHFKDIDVDSYSGEFSVNKFLTINSLKVESKLDKKLLLTRSITFEIDNSAMFASERIDSAEILTFFQNILDTFESNQEFNEKGITELKEELFTKYTIKFISNDKADISNLTSEIIYGLTSSLDITINESSKLVKYSDYFYLDDYDSYISVLNQPLIYELDLGHYDIKKVNDSLYNEMNQYDFVINDKILRVEGTYFSLNLDLKYNYTFEIILYGSIALGIIGVLYILLMLHFKKHPDAKEKFMSKLKSDSSNIDDEDEEDKIDTRNLINTNFRDEVIFEELNEIENGIEPKSSNEDVNQENIESIKKDPLLTDDSVEDNDDSSIQYKVIMIKSNDNIVVLGRIIDNSVLKLPLSFFYDGLNSGDIISVKQIDNDYIIKKIS